MLHWDRTEAGPWRYRTLRPQTDQIGADLAGLLVVDPVDRLVAGIGDLFSVLGNLDLRHEITVLVLDCCELVHAAEGRGSPWK